MKKSIPDSSADRLTLPSELADMPIIRSRFLFLTVISLFSNNSRFISVSSHPRQDEDELTDILATTDLSAVGQDVLLTGVALAKQMPSRLSVLHVVEDMADRYVRRTGLSDEQISDYTQKSQQKAEHGVHSQLAATDYRTLEHGVQVHVASGAADASILNAIAGLRINLLIIATQARGGMTGVLLGNTAERLLSEVPCSIFAIKPEGFVSPVNF